MDVCRFANAKTLGFRYSRAAMAQLKIDGSDLVVELTPLERLGALCSGVRVPLSSVISVKVTDSPYSVLRGMRIGTALPFVIVLGRMVTWSSGTDFVALYGTPRSAIITLEGAGFARLILSDPDLSVLEQLITMLDARTEA